MILVTGATGFIGRPVCRELAGSAVAWVGVGSDVMLRPAGGQVSASPFAWSRDALADLLAAERPGAVVHLAGSPAGHPSDHWLLLQDLLASLEKAKLCPRVVLASSAAVYGPQASPRPVAEDDRLTPVSDYGKAKLAAEALLAEAASGGGVDGVVCRLFNPIGPGQRFGVLADIVNQIDLAAPAHGPLEITVRHASPERDFVDVRDAARWFVALASSQGPLPWAVNLCHGEAVSVAGLAAALAEVLGRRLILGESEPGRIDSVIGDPTRLRRLFPETTRIALARSIADLVQSRQPVERDA